MTVDFEVRPADDQPPILVCSRIGCRCTTREELVYIVGEQYYCKRCFGDFTQQHELGELTRWEWITGFRAWAATTPVLNEYLQQSVNFAAFERQARTLARSPEVELLYRQVEETEKQGEEAYTPDSALSTAIRLTRLLATWDQTGLLERLKLAVDRSLELAHHREALEEQARRQQK